MVDKDPGRGFHPNKSFHYKNLVTLQAVYIFDPDSLKPPRPFDGPKPVSRVQDFGHVTLTTGNSGHAFPPFT
jgi:hypothetical protein